MTIRILYAEDEPDIREVVEMSLGLDPDFETRCCGSGQEALTVSIVWAPDIILLDVMMCAMDGPTTFARLQENALTAGIPVVFMTARAQARDLELLRSLGAAGVISKPFDPMTLAAAVRAYLKPADDQFGELRKEFLCRLGADAAALSVYRSELTCGKVEAATLNAMRGIAHTLAGAGGIYGYCEISDVAAVLEEAIVVEPRGFRGIERIAAAADRLLASIATKSVVQTRLMHPPLHL